ncbi:MAG: polymer-forming cytoskeletal protein [Holophagaceae bacterium]
MFAQKKRNDSVNPVHSLLGKGTTWKGEIHTGETSLRVEGHVDGAIHSEGEVTVAPSGLVTGTIHAKHLIVTGKAVGVFKIAECLEIHGSGCVEGEVEVGSLVVDEGGILQGTCTRRGHKATVPAPKPAEKAADKPVEKHQDKNGAKNGTRLPDSKPAEIKAGETRQPESVKAGDPAKAVEAKMEELLVGAGKH